MAQSTIGVVTLPLVRFCTAKTTPLTQPTYQAAVASPPRDRYATDVATGILALMGSGETAPGMTKIHRALLSRPGELRAVNLDTTYGFQENVPQMTEKLTEYFATSLQTAIKTLHFTSYERSSDLERTLFKRQVQSANYVFAGPGSPSYALGQWQPLGLVSDLEAVLRSGGTICFSSAAAVTLGAYCAPIYEIYKVGVTPYWLDGLNLTACLGLNCVVIPHFDNAEGGNYDTRHCYLGERRLVAMESQLPEGVATLGIDEHTVLIIDLESDSVEVRGKSNGYWRLGGETTVLANGSTTALSELRSIVRSAPRSTPTPVETQSARTPESLAAQVADGGPHANEALAQLVLLAATGGSGYIDPAPLIESVLALRVEARAGGEYQLADQLRDLLLNAGVDVRDQATHSIWSLRPTTPS